MQTNAKLNRAKNAKNDEFYTRYADIEAEVNAYVEHNPHVFENKTILCPCDDPDRSNFTKYFVDNFERFDLKKLISTCYQQNGHGKLFIMTHNSKSSGYLKGDGDFRSEEVTALRDQADMIVTNPPFSLFREFLAWILKAGKKRFLIVGHLCAITYKGVFPLLKANEIWLGAPFPKHGAWFDTPTGSKHFHNCRWFTNIDYKKQCGKLQLHTMVWNLKHNKRLLKKLATYGVTSYPRYDNYDAIEVPFVEAIPFDYEGVMGVPITFLDKYDPDQFEIVGTCENLNLYGLQTRHYTKQECRQRYFELFGKPGTYDLNSCSVINGRKTYRRILIRKL